MKRFFAVIICIVLCLNLSACSGGDRLEVFYNKLAESGELLDKVGEDIYWNWHDAIYEDAFNSDIDEAIYAAQMDNYDNLERMYMLDGEIIEMFKQLKDGKKQTVVRRAMDAYSDYFECVFDVKGSYNSYSEEFDSCQKAFTNALRELSYEV